MGASAEAVVTLIEPARVAGFVFQSSSPPGSRSQYAQPIRASPITRRFSNLSQTTCSAENLPWKCAQVRRDFVCSLGETEVRLN